MIVATVSVGAFVLAFLLAGIIVGAVVLLSDDDWPGPPAGA